MKNIKVMLLLVISIQHHVSVVGTRQSSPMEDSTAQAAQNILNTKVMLVPQDFDFCMNKREFDRFITNIKTEYDDENLLREHFAAARVQGLLYSKCLIRSKKVETQTVMTLRDLLAQIPDSESKKVIVTKVVNHRAQRDALIAQAPHGISLGGFHHHLDYILDVSQEIVDLVSQLSTINK